MTYRLKTISDTGTIMVVGCGGTGGFVAEGLCRLPSSRERSIILVDHDTVEERNIGRQNFYREDIGKFKSRVLAERLVRQFGARIQYWTERIENLTYGWRGMLTIGCVDNALARKKLEIGGLEGMGFVYDYSYFDGWYIDAGNGEHHGQVLIGNTRMQQMKKVFLPDTGICWALPLPTVQQPALLVPDKKPRRDCAAAVARDEQSPVINRMMADLVLTFVHRLLAGTLTWMAAYIDLEAGTMNAVEATPEAVARITGQQVRNLEYRPRRK
jgi:PRTRC genetic system ThiF family protein